MRPPYPVAIPPLLPAFLRVRRRGFDFALRAVERLGIDRPALAFVVEREILGDWLTLDDGLPPYATTSEPLLAAAAAARAAGLVAEAYGRWALTERGRILCRELRDAAHSYLSSLEPIPDAECRRLAGLLESAFAAAALAAAPRHDLMPRTFRFRGGVAAESAMVALENAVHGLWTFRDECHAAAWRDAGMHGPALDVLTHLWRGGASSTADLIDRLGAQRPDDVRADLVELRERGLVEAGDPPRLTSRGASHRELIERETDRLFFEPWPAEVGAGAERIREQLAAANASLAGERRSS